MSKALLGHCTKINEKLVAAGTQLAVSRTAVHYFLASVTQSTHHVDCVTINKLLEKVSADRITFFTSFRDGVGELVELDVNCMSLRQVVEPRAGSTRTSCPRRPGVLRGVVDLLESSSTAAVGHQMIHLDGYGGRGGASRTGRTTTGRRRSSIDRRQRHWRVNLN